MEQFYFELLNKKINQSNKIKIEQFILMQIQSTSTISNFYYFEPFVWSLQHSH